MNDGTKKIQLFSFEMNSFYGHDHIKYSACERVTVEYYQWWIPIDFIFLQLFSPDWGKKVPKQLFCKNISVIRSLSICICSIRIRFIWSLLVGSMYSNYVPVTWFARKISSSFFRFLLLSTFFHFFAGGLKNLHKIESTVCIYSHDYCTRCKLQMVMVLMHAKRWYIFCMKQAFECSLQNNHCKPN